MKKALIFDCDGVLGDTEQFGHLVAFNRMWMDLGVPWQWSVEEYGRKLKIAGRRRRQGTHGEPVCGTGVPEGLAGGSHGRNQAEGNGGRLAQAKDGDL